MKFKILQFCFLLVFLAALPVRAADVLYPVEVTIFSCNGNGICETVNGENEVNCSADCGCNNNSICEADRFESIANCASDCLASSCGNGVCDSGLGETFGNCVVDCHCGNGNCDWSETNSLCPADCQTTGGGGGTYEKLEIDQLQIFQKNYDQALISWMTNTSASCQLFWGGDFNLSAGVASEAFIEQRHSAQLPNLVPDQTYYLKIVCTDVLGQEALLENVSFLIKGEVIPAPAPIINVSNLTVTVINHQAELSWSTPVGKNYNEVIVRRSTDFYPSLTSGELVYRGPGVEVDGKYRAIDSKFANKNTYYSVYTTDGKNYSSGVLTGVVMFGVIALPNVSPDVEIITPYLSFESLFGIYALNLYDFDFINAGVKLPFLGDLVTLKSNQSPLTVGVNAGRVPKDINSVILVITGNNSVHFLRLSPDVNNTFISATLAGLMPGDYRFDIILYNKYNQPIRDIRGQLRTGVNGSLENYIQGVNNLPIQPIYKNIMAGSLAISVAWYDFVFRYWYLVAILLILLTFLLAIQRRKRKK